MRISRTGKIPTICVTVGDPRGIGPEVTAKALRDPSLRGIARLTVIGELGSAGRRPGERASARRSIEYIEEALGLIGSGKADALVTGPVSKESISRSGIDFAGHTEYLARRSGSKKFAMMFVSPDLRLSLVTRHIPLIDVSGALTPQRIADTVSLTYESLRKDFKIPRPTIGVAGLNPHCGEGGLFGVEEKRIITPTIKKLARRFSTIYGPIPGDTLLFDLYRRRYDAGVCMYHDQGLPAFKMIARSTGVNVTLGLPFVRTSVDHGTGFDIAGKGIADPGSMIAAIRLAARMTSTC
ncbi:MAG: 4-hydroxythreonine-4-phosphate dehydrogenase PdxA [Candidatus Omnitrophota bacterium]